MDYGLYFEKYADRLIITDGLDVQTTIGFGDFLGAPNHKVLNVRIKENQGIASGAD